MSAPDPRERDLVKCEDMRLHAERACGYPGDRTLEEFLDDDLIQAAVIRCVEVVGEAARLVSEETRAQPEPIRGVTRVSGPFTVEAVQPPEMTLGGDLSASRDREGADFDGVPAELEGSFTIRPVEPTNELEVANVAAWFLDGDYDGRTFCVTQAFFPDRSAWEKLQRALNGKDGPIDAERFEAFSSTVNLPFPKGKHGCVAVKVIDPRGNEVMAVEKVNES